MMDELTIDKIDQNIDMIFMVELSKIYRNARIDLISRNNRIYKIDGNDRTDKMTHKFEIFL